MTRCAALLALAALVIGVAACSDASGTSATNGSGAGGAATATATSGGAPAATATATTAASTYQIEVFFSKHPDSDSNPAAVFPVHRTAPNLQVATYAIQQLIAGPTAGEQASGYYTPLMGNLSGASNCGGADFQITLNKKGTTPEQGTATLTFCRAVNSNGVVSDAQITSEVTASLKQFSTISKVVILTGDGGCFGDESGQNRCLH
jgi:hypothetical protein